MVVIYIFKEIHRFSEKTAHPGRQAAEGFEFGCTSGQVVASWAVSGKQSGSGYII